jgi:hypothetical protein
LRFFSHTLLDSSCTRHVHLLRSVPGDSGLNPGWRNRNNDVGLLELATPPMSTQQLDEFRGAVDAAFIDWGPSYNCFIKERSGNLPLNAFLVKTYI